MALGGGHRDGVNSFEAIQPFLARLLPLWNSLFICLTLQHEFATQCPIAAPSLAIVIMNTPPRRAAKRKGKTDSPDVGSVADFMELVNSTVGKHFRCCICFR